MELAPPIYNWGYFFFSIVKKPFIFKDSLGTLEGHTSTQANK